jgi:cytochrome c
MDDRFNTIAGWALFAGIVALGASIATGEMFHNERPEPMGYPIEGVVQEGEGGEAEKPVTCFLAAADVAKGQQVFAKCAACHNAEPGGANALGPALYGVMGNPVAGHPGFAFTDALKSKGGTWDWNVMSEWLKSPKAFAPGTKMTFAGLGKPEDRANLMAFLNSRDNSPVPVPPAGPECAEGAAAPATGTVSAPGANTADAPANQPRPGTGPGDGPQRAEDEPQPVSNQAGADSKNVGGEGSPGAGRAPGERQ